MAIALIVPPKPEKWPKENFTVQTSPQPGQHMLWHDSCDGLASRAVRLTSDELWITSVQLESHCAEARFLHARRLTRYAQQSQSMQTTMCSPWTTPGRMNRLYTLGRTSWTRTDARAFQPFQICTGRKH